ncbi:unnamed protein product [Calicophoron daubneyi]|uniref:PI31 proteasome regulator C-terminal domain-containing protein n=1 Tax=Calicophoron daubneyi TaxID=300641 RepID=A0AAV2T1P0_CALDB
MTDKPPNTGTSGTVSDTAGSANPHKKLGSVESSLLEYVLIVHGKNTTRRACLATLLIHAQLLARGARLTSPDGRLQAVIPPDTLNSDPIRLTYNLVPRPNSEALASAVSQLQLSVAETDAQIFVSLTDTTTDKFGHLELSGVEHIRQNCDAECARGDYQFVYPQLEELLGLIEENLWKPVLPSPPLYRPYDSDRKKEKKDSTPISDECQPQRFHPPYTGIRPIASGSPFPDYGRSDLDPLGGLAGRGGMILDPRRPLITGGIGGSLIGGPDVLPPGSVPPGARFDPFGPGVMPSRQLGRPRAPDPDHALPPGYEDMYM